MDAEGKAEDTVLTLIGAGCRELGLIHYFGEKSQVAVLLFTDHDRMP